MRQAQSFNILLVISTWPDDFLGFKVCIILFISASVIGIHFILGKFPGNKFFRIEIASPFSVCWVLNFPVIVTKKLIKISRCLCKLNIINPLTPNNPYSGRTAPLTSKCCILYIYSTNTGTEYFKHGIYSPFFSLQNAVSFIILIYLVPVLFTFYIQSVLKFKKIILAPNG